MSADCDELDGTVGRAHVCGAIPEMSLSENNHSTTAGSDRFRQKKKKIPISRVFGVAKQPVPVAA